MGEIRARFSVQEIRLAQMVTGKDHRLVQEREVTLYPNSSCESGVFGKIQLSGVELNGLRELCLGQEVEVTIRPAASAESGQWIPVSGEWEHVESVESDAEPSRRPELRTCRHRQTSSRRKAWWIPGEVSKGRLCHWLILPDERLGEPARSLEHCEFLASYEVV